MQRWLDYLDYMLLNLFSRNKQKTYFSELEANSQMELGKSESYCIENLEPVALITANKDNRIYQRWYVPNGELSVLSATDEVPHYIETNPPIGRENATAFAHPHGENDCIIVIEPEDNQDPHFTRVVNCDDIFIAKKWETLHP